MRTRGYADCHAALSGPPPSPPPPPPPPVQVFSEFIAQCGRGLTPNPDLACNRHIKFDALLRFAAELGADSGEPAALPTPGQGWHWEHTATGGRQCKACSSAPAS